MALYLEHFGLKEPPFSISPNPRFLFMSRQHREALAHLRHGLEAGGGVIVLTGEVGCGKTTISRRLLRELPENVDVAWIINPRLDARELLSTICTELGIEAPDAATPPRLTECISRALLDRHAGGRNTLLMIDEAQHLSREALEQVRLLTNLETDEQKLLQVLLIGQPELRVTLARHDLRQLEQRIVARFHIEPLSPKDTARMVAYRWRVAGGGQPPFTRASLRRLHREAGGIPRRINLIADRALLGAYAGDERRIRARHVRQAASEIRGAPARAAIGWRAPALAISVALLAWGWSMVAETPSRPDTTLAGPSPSNPAAVPPPSGDTAAPAEAPPAPWPIITRSGNDARALATLARLWEPKLDAGPDCDSLRQARLACLTIEADLRRLRSLDRPALLRIAGPDGEGSAVLVALSGETARLQLDGKSWRVPIAELEQRRDARVTLLWRTPRGWHEPVRPGDEGPIVQWLNRQLDHIVGALVPPSGARMDRRAVERLREFQRREGLRPDGAAGPLTLMRLNDALALPRPSLRGSGRKNAPDGAVD
ncbi:MAG: AAA family ATPase [Mariprofundaceae bacterium]